MMCESKLLGLRGCTEEAPVTGLYIDQLGITESFISNLNSDQYNTPAEMFIDQRSVAWSKLKTLMLSSINKFLKADTVIENRRVGQISQDYTLKTSATTSYNGIRLILQPQQSSFLKLYLSDLQIYIDSSVIDKTVYVFDLITGEKLSEITYLVGGDVQYVGQEFLSARRKMDIAIVYESTEESIKTIPKAGSCTDCSGRVKDVIICPFISAIGIQLDYDGTTISNVANKPVTYGMTLNYNISCDRESYLCSVGATMSMALSYATAIEIYDYALTVSPNQRVNTAVTINAESLMTARDIMAEKFNTEMEVVYKNFRVPDDRHCFNCDRNMVYGSKV